MILLPLLKILVSFVFSFSVHFRHIWSPLRWAKRETEVEEAHINHKATKQEPFFASEQCSSLQRTTWNAHTHYTFIMSRIHLSVLSLFLLTPCDLSATNEGRKETCELTTLDNCQFNRSVPFSSKGVHCLLGSSSFIPRPVHSSFAPSSYYTYFLFNSSSSSSSFSLFWFLNQWSSIQSHFHRWSTASTRFPFFLSLWLNLFFFFHLFFLVWIVIPSFVWLGVIILLSSEHFKRTSTFLRTDASSLSLPFRSPFVSSDEKEKWSNLTRSLCRVITCRTENNSRERTSSVFH